MDKEAYEMEQKIEEEMLDTMECYLKGKGIEVDRNTMEQMLDPEQGESLASPENEQEILQAMQNFAANHMQEKYEFLVRGALLQCEYGTHCRKLNLPLCHGVSIFEQPLMNAGDCVCGIEGPELNVTFFGICNSPDKPPTEVKCFKNEAPRNPDGTFTGEEAKGVTQGHQCKPHAVGGWQNVHRSTQIGEGGDAALTTNSFLVCQHQGIIRVIQSGQEDPESSSK